MTIAAAVRVRMKSSPKLFAVLAVLALASCAAPAPPAPTFGLVVHGGAGDITPETVDPEKAELYRAKLEEVVRLGHGVLAAGGTSLDAVEAVITELEDSPLFNAGKGAVFTADGRNELDASIMDGFSHNSGAVAGVTRIRNPIKLARLVMDESPHVMMSGAGAEAFAEIHGITMETSDYFFTEERWRALQDSLATPDEHGTVGCVALDQYGNLAAGTSTGGMTGKRFGRIGDSPVIGAGTYADNATCAVSCTGHGEFFIRFVVAYDITALMKYRGLSVDAAARSVIEDKLVKAGGQGGVIAIDRNGNISTPFNTEGMYRASMVGSAEPTVEMFAQAR